MSSPVDALRPAAARLRMGWVARRWRALRFRDALLVTALPLTAVFLLFADAAWRYARAIQFEDWWSARASVPGFFAERVHELTGLPARLALRQGFSPEMPDAGIIRLDVPRRSWDSLQGDPLALWGTWIDGTLRYAGAPISVRLRKRGDNSIHWVTDKRSLTVRTPRDDFYKSFRSFALSVRDPLSSYLANRLGAEFKLLMPRTEVVPVFLNNQFYGMYRLVEPVDESFLRSADRMPGNVFRGDAAERGEYYKGTIRSLFENPYLWERVAVNERWTSAGASQLAMMVADLRGTTFADHQRLMARFDRDELSRLLAYLLFVGDPFHMDRIHNQFLYEDPSTQLLHPIPWDVRLRDASRPEERPINDLFQAALSDPFVVEGVTRELHDALERRRIEDTADSLVSAVERRYAGFLAYDRSRSGLIPEVGTAAEASAQIRANGRLLRRWLATDTVAFNYRAAAGSGVLDFETRGYVGADLEALRVTGGGRPRLVQDRNLDGVLDRDDPEIEATWTDGTLTLARPLPLRAGWSTSGFGVAPGRMAYRLFLIGGAAARVDPVLRNRVTAAPAALVAWPEDSPIVPSTGWHPWRYSERRPTTHRLRGDVHLRETLRVPPEDSLVIEPGTTLRLDPDVSIVARGPVRAVGTASRPIRVVPASPGRPWGTFSLQGAGTSGSMVRHAEFIEGGGALVDRIEYIGMVNVHRATGVVFDSVLFQSNRRSDDTFHALQSSVDLTRSRFVDANSDAVDYDIADGDIRDNQFDGSGGDAIDLMESNPRIIGNRIRRAGDKGISVGEASHPFVFGNVIEGAAIGVEIKDGSAPVLLNNEFNGAGIGLRSRLKNWRYGASGFGTIVNTSFERNTSRAELDSLARLVTAGVAGIDSGETAAAPRSVPWLYAAYGIEVDSSRIGLPGAWRAIEPRPAVESHRFRDDFLSLSDGWEAGARVTRLDKRGNALVVDVEGGPGAVTRPVSWDLRATGGGVLVLAVSTRDVDSIRVVADGTSGIVERTIQAGGALTRFALEEMPLPAGRYRSVRLEVHPTPGLSHIQRATGLSVLRAGRVALRSYAVYPAAAPSPAPR